MTKTKLIRLLELALAVVLLSACRVVVDTRVNSDGSGELRSAVVFSAAETEHFAQDPANASKSICDDLKDDVQAEATFIEEVRDGETYCTTIQSFANVGELRQLYGSMGSVTVNRLNWQFGRLVFDADIDLTNRGNEENAEGIATEWRLTLPGVLGGHNAERIEGQTLVWEVAPGERANLHAESAAGLSLATLGTIPLIIVGCGLALVIAGGVAAVWLARRRRTPAGS